MRYNPPAMVIAKKGGEAFFLSFSNLCDRSLDANSDLSFASHFKFVAFFFRTSHKMVFCKEKKGAF